TGRDFGIAGELQLGLSLIPTLVVDGVTLGNADWGSQPTMLKVDHFKARVSLPALLAGNITITEVILDSADILLETNTEGKGNWVFTSGEKAGKKPEKTGAETSPELSIDEVQISNARISYNNAQTGKMTRVNIDEFRAETGGFTDSMDLLLQAVYDEIPVRIDGTLGSLGAYTSNEEFPLDITANIGQAELTLKGHVEKPRDLKGMDVDMAFHSDSLSDFEKITGKELPKVGPVKLAGHLSEKDGIYFIKAARAEVAETELNVDGSINNPKEIQGLDLVITFEADSLTPLGEATGMALPSISPVKLTTRLTDKENTFRLSELFLQAGNTDLKGSATLNMTGERPALTANLTSDMIDLTPFTGDKKREKEEREKTGKVFSSDPLPFDILKSVDADLDIQAAQVKTEDLVLSKVDIRLNLEKGHLKLSPVNADVAGGTYSLNLDLNASSGKSGIFNTTLDIKNFQPSRLPDMQDKISGASTDISFKGNGSGKSIADIMAGLNGHLLVKVREGEIKSNKFSILDSDLIASTLNTLNPSSSTDSGRKIECGVVNMKIEDGIAKSDKNIALLTKRMSVVGSGIINLKTEELNIGVKPRAREGLGISPGSLAELVRIGGTLAEPKAVPDTVAAFRTAASVGAAVATGGVSLLAEGLLKKSQGKSNPCDVALGIKTAQEQTDDSKAGAEETSVTEKAVDKVKETGKSITEGLKGLFD
ncbi:MAG TPA: AsmA family protein, partial [Gammaproteobacteria bacterium]|nr:AsmA family protein [Gammaproteobacteria bacterium]